MTVTQSTGRVLRLLVRASCWRPTLTVALSLLLAGAGITYTLHALAFKTSSRDLLPPGQRYAVLFEEYSRDFGELEDITVVVEGRTLEESKAYASRLGREIRRSPIKFQRVAYRVDPKRFEGRALLYLSKEELAEIRDRIFDYQEFMEAFAGNPSLEQLLSGIDRQVAAGFLTHFFDLGLRDAGAPTDFKFLQEVLSQISERLDRPLPYRSPWGALFTLDRREEDAGYFLSDDRSLLFVLVEPASQKGSFTADRDAIEAIRGIIAALRQEFPHVQVGVTGAPALSNDEMTTAFKDSQVATLLAFALTLGVLMVAFRRVGKPLLMLLVLAVSLAWSLGVVTLTVGHLSIFSVMFISIVVGIGIDYGIYFLFRYEEELALGRSLEEALEISAARSGPGILYGALTAAAAFYVLALTDFRGIQELGIIAGSAILLAWLSMMTLFPAILTLTDRRHAHRPRSGNPPRARDLARTRVPVLERLTRHPKSILAGSALFTAFSLWAVSTVAFDYNLLNLQAKGTESVLWEEKILARARRSGFTGLATATELAELRGKHDAFDRLSAVSEVDSVLLLIPEDQREKIRIINDFAPLVAPVRIGLAHPVDLEGLMATLASLRRRFDIAAEESGPRGPGKEVQAVRAEIVALQDRLARVNREEAEAALGYLQSQLSQDFAEKFHHLQRNLHPRPVGLTDIPEELRRKFIGKSGRFLLQIHPRVNIWDRKGAEAFVGGLRQVDPDVTGTPVITYEAIRLMETAYLQGTLYALLAVGALAIVIFRRLREILLALIPLALGTLWTVGLMYLFGLRLNLANVWGIPLIVGTAAEYGLNVVVRSVEARRHGGPFLGRSTVMAVIVSGLTTIVGFGSLMIAQHRGIFGLGLLLTVGAGACLLSSLVVLPVLIRLFGEEVEEPSRITRLPAA